MDLGGKAAPKSGDWYYLRRELKRRTLQPLSDAPFVIYVFCVIIGLGCLGIWVELSRVVLSAGTSDYGGVLTALSTFFPALIGSSSLQLILASTSNRDKVLVSFGYFVSIVAFAAAVLISIFHAMFPNATFLASVGFAVLAVWLWCFTNGDDPTYKSAPVDAPSGGDTSKPLKGDPNRFPE